MSDATDAPKTFLQKTLDVVEKVGNQMPHPAIIFLSLILLVLVFAHILFLAGLSVTNEVLVPVYATTAAQPGEGTLAADATTDVYYGVKQVQGAKSYRIEKQTITVRSLLTVEGIRFMYTSLIPNFMNFAAVGLMIVAMVGAGVAEEAGLVKALIRKLVIVSPRALLTYILVFVGIVSSVAADAGYLVLIPLAGSAFLSLGRHPLAGLATGFAAVAGAFTVNVLIKPLDAVLTEFTNDAIRLVDPNRSIGLTANLWFSLASVPFLTVVIALITERVIEPRLGKFAGDKPEGDQGALSSEESRGLRFAGLGVLAVLVVFGLLTIPPGAPLRHPETGEIFGNSPFMNGLIAAIMILFLVTGAAYGYGAGTLNTSAAIIKAMEKAVAGLGGLIFLLLIISQFIAYFNFTNMATVLALQLGGTLRQANIHPLLLLLAFIVVVALLDLLITGAIAKWALFAPVFIPLLVPLGVDPAAVLAAYRIGDSPMNAISPLNAYFMMVVTIAQKYDKDAGVGTVVSLMLPYVIVLFAAWTSLFAVWYLLGIPWGV